MIETESTTGGTLAGGETVQVNVSVSVAAASRDGHGHAVGAGRPAASVPLMTPVAGAMVMPAGQAGRAVGQCVAVGVGRVGVEADGVADGVAAAIAEVGAEDRRAVDDRDGVEVDGALLAVPSLTLTRTRIRSPLSPLPAVARFERGARGAGDVGAVAAPLVARGERVAVGVVARDVRGQRLVGHAGRPA